MGGTSSSLDTSECREMESQAASVAALPLLRSSFSAISASSPSSSSPPSSPSSSSYCFLSQCFSLKYKSLSSDDSRSSIPECLPGILDNMGAAITETLFGKEEMNWVEYMRGYLKGCGRMSASSHLDILFRIIASAAHRVGVDMHIQSPELECNTQELLIILWICWIMASDSHSHSLSHEDDVSLPDISHLLLSALVYCHDIPATDINHDDHDHDHLLLPVGKIYTWAIQTLPNLAHFFSAFINSRLNSLASPNPLQPTATQTSSAGPENTSLAEASKSFLLTPGRAWSLSLSQRSSISDEILSICFPSTIDVIEDNLLYRSRAHGKGLNRFWSNVEGYHGPVLVLISATSGESSESSSKWIIGALTHQGFENRDVFYGGGGYLYSIGPIFHAFSASALGKEQNYVYSHLHPAVRAYDPHPKPEGIGFGGSLGNERIFIDEDFAKVTVRHHAVDKTYRHGPLFPNQGYLPVEASILDLEVWGFGGKAAKAVQMSYKKREELFTEQRRKIDLKTFANWEDSPEKMMMDMMGNPNTVQREER